MADFVSSRRSITYHYDAVQDMLYVLFEPVNGVTFYDDVASMPGIMLRLSADERVVGITVHHLTTRLEGQPTEDTALRRFVHELLARLEPILVTHM